MVGVPRLSQGCLRCRRLKKGCDRQRPMCSHCQRSNVECQYKERQWTFVTAPESSSSALRGSPAALKHDAAPVEVAQAQNQTRLIVLEDTLASTARAIGVVDEFWALYMPRDFANTTYLDGRVSVPWASHVQQYAIPEAVEACAFMLVGDVKKLRSCNDAGRRFYVSGLRKVNAYLQDPDTMDIKTVMATIKVLSLYEHLRKSEDNKPGTQAADWRQHIKGICHILQYRGSDLTVGEGGNDLFENIHLNAITVNIMIRRRELKLRERYQQRPRSLRGQLLLIMDDIPACFAKHDELLARYRLDSEETSTSTDIIRQAQVLLHETEQVMRSLQEWEQNVLIDCYTKGGMPLQSASSLAECCMAFGLGFLYTVTLYWTACLLTMSTLKTTTVLLQRLTTDGKATSLPLWMESRPYATKIAKHAKDYFSASAGLWGADAATFPFGMVRRFCYAYGLDNSSEMDMLRNATASQTTGESTDAFIRSVYSRSVPDNATDTQELRLSQQDARNWYGVSFLS